MKRLFLAGCLVVLGAPYAPFATGNNNNNNNDGGKHQKSAAPEMPGLALWAAAAIGAAGYVVLRRRHIRQN